MIYSLLGGGGVNIQWTGLFCKEERYAGKIIKKTMGGGIGRNIHSLCLEKSVSGSSKLLGLPHSQN